MTQLTDSGGCSVEAYARLLAAENLDYSVKLAAIGQPVDAERMTRIGLTMRDCYASNDHEFAALDERWRLN